IRARRYLRQAEVRLRYQYRIPDLIKAVGSPVPRSTKDEQDLELEGLRSQLRLAEYDHHTESSWLSLADVAGQTGLDLARFDVLWLRYVNRLPSSGIVAARLPLEEMRADDWRRWIDEMEPS